MKRSTPIPSVKSEPSVVDLREQSRHLNGVGRMTLIQIEKRVRALEQTVEHLAHSKPAPAHSWYRTHSGRFAGDPVFDEIIQLGRAYRQSQRPPGCRKRS